MVEKSTDPPQPPTGDGSLAGALEPGEAEPTGSLYARQRGVEASGDRAGQIGRTGDEYQPAESPDGFPHSADPCLCDTVCDADPCAVAGGGRGVCRGGGHGHVGWISRPSTIADYPVGPVARSDRGQITGALRLDLVGAIRPGERAGGYSHHRPRSRRDRNPGYCGDRGYDSVGGVDGQV